MLTLIMFINIIIERNKLYRIVLDDYSHAVSFINL